MFKIKRPKIGEYVLVSKWQDHDYHDPWGVGFISEIVENEQGIFYYLKQFPKFRFRHCWRITKAEGKERIKASKIFNPPQGE